MPLPRFGVSFARGLLEYDEVMSQSDYIRLRSQSRFAVLVRKIRVALTPRSWCLRAKLRGGVVVAGRNRPGWGGRGIYIFREDLEPELDILRGLVPRGGVFIDIGANVGVYSIVAGALVGSGGVVLSVEPFPEILAQLHANVQANDFGDRIRIRNFCVSDKTGPLTFWMNRGRPHAFSLQREGNAAGLSVLSIRLDDLTKWEGLTRLDYLKIDAEGAEEAILEGGRDSIGRFRPVVQVEDENRRIWRQLPEYVAYEVAGTRNTLLIPGERAGQVASELSADWRRLESIPSA